MATGIIGQGRAKKQVESWLRSERLPHTILIDGRPGVGKRDMALTLAKGINCQRENVFPCGECLSCTQTDSLTHPDVHTLMPLPPARGRGGDESQLMPRAYAAALEYLKEEAIAARSNHNIPVDLVRLVQGQMHRSPTAGGRRICLIFEADRMHPAAANSLLKTLEEPPRQAVFVLVTSSADRLLPTVVSRCQRLRLQPLSREQLRLSLLDDGVSAEGSELGARFGEGSMSRAQETLADEFQDRRRTVERFLDDAVKGDDGGYWRLLDDLDVTQDKTQLEHFLRLSGLYLRDLFLLDAVGGNEVLNVDRLDTMSVMAQTIDGSRIEAAADAVEKAYEHLEMNVSPAIILADFWRALSPTAAISNR